MENTFIFFFPSRKRPGLALQAIFLTDNWHANGDVFNTHLAEEARTYADSLLSPI